MVLLISYVTHVNLYTNYTHLSKYGLKTLSFYGSVIKSLLVSIHPTDATYLIGTYIVIFNY